MKQDILNFFQTECPWRDTLYWYDEIDSTNTEAKRLAKDGAPHGTVLVAGRQTAGRGRLGRQFSSPEGMGVYLSVILRPDCPASELMHLTCAAAVAACRAVSAACGFMPQVKWINDLVYGGKKLGGILTELSVDSATGKADYAIIGIGINCQQEKADFPAELQDMAISVKQITGAVCSPVKVAAALTEALHEMSKTLLSGKVALMDEYRRLCMTLGKEVLLVRGDEKRHATALDLDENGGLTVRNPDGTEETVSSGEVSVRGMYGYL